MSALPKFVEFPDPSIYRRTDYAVIDFETSNFEHGSALDGRNEIVLATVGVETEGRLRTHVFDQEFVRVREYVEHSSFIIAHNAKFELQWLRRLGLDLRRVLVFDTLLAEYVIAGNRSWDLDLDSVCTRYGLPGKGPFIDRLMKIGVNPADMPREALIERNRLDVETTHGIFKRQLEILDRDNLTPVVYSRCLVTPCLADIERNGVKLDEQRVRDTTKDVTGRYDRSVAELGVITGGINLRSSKQVANFLYNDLSFKEPEDYRGIPKRTPAGNPKTDSDTIASLVATTKEQKRFKKTYEEYANVKQLNDVILKLLTCVENDDGMLYARFNQSVTRNHRTSSTGGKYKVQFQNFPREFKRLFTSRSEDFKLCEADAPQLEFRVATELGSDRVALGEICTGVDVHRLTSAIMRLERNRAKPYTFKPLYGGNSGTNTERKYYKAFREKYFAIYNEQTKWVNEVLASGVLTTCTGLKFYWPDTRITQSGYIVNTASIFNYPVSNLATADIIPLTLVIVWYKIASLKTFIVNTIHDSIIAEVDQEEVDTYKQILVEAFTRDIYTMLKRLYGLDFKTPLGVGIKIGKFWGEGKEEKYESTDKIEAVLRDSRSNEPKRVGGRSIQVYE